MATNSTKWQIDCRRMSMDKSSNRVDTPPDRVAELYGIDGRLPGGFRPFPGMLKIRTLGTLTPTNARDLSSLSDVGTFGWTASTKTLTKTGAFTSYTWNAGDLLQIQQNGEATIKPGLYEIVSRTSDDAVVLRESVADGDLTAKGYAVFCSRSALSSITEIYDCRGFSMKVDGKNAIHGWVVRCKGLKSGANIWQTFVEFYDPLAAAYKSFVLEETALFDSSGSNTATNTPLESTALLDVVSYGRVMYVLRRGAKPILFYVKLSSDRSSLEFPNNSTSKAPYYNTGPGYPATLYRVKPSSALLGAYTPTSQINGAWPSRVCALGTSITGTDEAPTDHFSNAAAIINGYSSVADWTTQVKELSDSVADGSGAASGLPAGNYSFAYQLVDEVTGRKSALSKIASYPTSRFGTDLHQYFAYELIYEDGPWTHAYIIRSVDSDTSGGVFTNSLLFKENYIRLANYQATETPTSTTSGTKRSLYWLTLEDRELVSQPLYNNKITFDPTMPFAGVGCVYDGTLVCSQINGSITADSSVGEIRWSSLTERSLEMFPPGNIYVPPKATETPIRMILNGDRVFGLAPNRQYMIYKASSYLTCREMHDGYGLVASQAASVVANGIYMTTPKGVVSVDVTGLLEAVRSTDYVIIEEWKNDLSTLSMAFDAKLGCLFLLRPPREPRASYRTDHGECCCFWMTTSITSQLMHTNYAVVTSGVVPNSSDDSVRAFFVSDSGAVFVVDANRSKSQICMAEVDDYTLTATVSSDSYSNPDVTLTLSGSPTLNSEMVGAVLTFTNGTLVGQSYEITAINNTSKTITIVTNSDITSSIAAGDRIAISPVPFRVLSGPIGLQAENGVSYGLGDLFRKRRINTIAPCIAGATGVSNNANAKMRAFVMKNLTTTTHVGAIPYTTDLASEVSIADGASNNHALVQCAGPLLHAGVETWVVGFDFILLGYIVTGSIENSDREGAAS